MKKGVFGLVIIVLIFASVGYFYLFEKEVQSSPRISERGGEILTYSDRRIMQGEQRADVFPYSQYAEEQPSFQTIGQQNVLTDKGIEESEFDGYIIGGKEESVVEVHNKNKLSRSLQEVLSVQKQKIQAEQNSLKQTLSQLNPNIKVKREFSKVINAIVVSDLTGEEVNALRSEGYKVSPNYQFEATLMDSVPLINADDVWKLDKDGELCVDIEPTPKPITANAIKGIGVPVDGSKKPVGQFESEVKECLTGEDVTVAIIDTGIDYTHSDFGSCTTFQDCPKFVGGYDFYDNDSDPMDEKGHGTHVAATVAGNGALKGVAPDAKLGNYRVCSPSGSCPVDDIIAAIEDAIDPNHDGNFEDRYDIISISLGGSGTPDDSSSQAVDNANDVGSLVVIAAGNFWGGAEYGDLDCDGCARKAFTAGATDKQDNIADFSGKGPVFYNGELIIKPDIVAPGVSICAADAYPNYPADCFDDEHLTLRGTSMATPHISGVAALVKQARSDWGPEEIKSALSQTTQNIQEDVYTQGSGRVDASGFLELEAIVRPHILNLGLIAVEDIQPHNFDFDMVNINPSSSVGIKIHAITGKNIQTQEGFSFDSTINQFCLQGGEENKQFSIDFSGLSPGYYSGSMEVEVFDDCDFEGGYSQTIHVPVGFVKLYKLNVTFVGTPQSSSYYLSHSNDVVLINGNGDVVKYSFDESGLQNNYDYVIYSVDKEVDVLCSMIENYYYPADDKLNVNYFISHLDLSVINSITFNETNAVHVQQNIVQTANSKDLKFYGFMTELLQKNDYWSDILYYFYPTTGPFDYVEFGIDATNTQNLFNDDYMIYFSPHGRDSGTDFETTQNYMILPFSVDYPFTDFDKIIGPGDLKNISLRIPDSLTSDFNNNFYFGVNSYTPLNYWSDADAHKINLPRNGVFYYLDNCDECYYHYKTVVDDDPSGNNVRIWTNYFDGTAKYIPETTEDKPSFVSFFEEPMNLVLSTDHCIEYEPGVFRFCNEAVLKGYLKDKFDAKVHITTEGTSGNLMIKTPSGNDYSIFSDDLEVLDFGRFGSWIINCDNYWYSSPDILENSVFCQEGNYTINWTIDDMIEGRELFLNAIVNYDEDNGFTVVQMDNGQPCPPNWQYFPQIDKCVFNGYGMNKTFWEAVTYCIVISGGEGWLPEASELEPICDDFNLRPGEVCEGYPGSYYDCAGFVRIAGRKLWHDTGFHFLNPHPVCDEVVYDFCGTQTVNASNCQLEELSISDNNKDYGLVCLKEPEF